MALVTQTGIMTRVETAASAPAVIIAGQRVRLLDRVRIYVCGITPYDVTHLEHGAAFVWVDALGRILRFLGVEPVVCRNVTDVDDVLDVEARRAGAAYDSFAAIQQFQFDQDMSALRVRSPEYEPRAHRYVPQVIRLASGLLDAGAAYERAGSVYFRGEQVAHNVGLDRNEAVRLCAERGGRPEDPAKANSLDVAVWQVSEPGHPAWDSPWGPGRPGWHAECAAMAMSVFGPAVDVHAGRMDLRFPHHAYHAAMVEAFSGVHPYARAWFHVGAVATGGAKAGPAGNLVLLRDLLAGHEAAAVRLMILDRPWASDWHYRPSLLTAAAARLDRLHQAAGRRSADAPAALDAIGRLLADDLSVSAALDLAIEAGGAAARTLARVLGLT